MLRKLIGRLSKTGYAVTESAAESWWVDVADVCEYVFAWAYGFGDEEFPSVVDDEDSSG